MTSAAPPQNAESAALSPRQTTQLAASGLVLIAVAYGLARFAYGLFVPAFRTEFGLDPGAVGMIGSASYAAYCLAIYPAMMLTPRLGSRTMAVITGALATIGTALVGLAPHAAVLALGVVLAGMSTGLASPPLAHAVSARVARPRRDRVQTIINAGTGLGVAVSGPVALLTLAHWRSAWLIFAAVALLTTLWVARSVPHARVPQPSPEPPRAERPHSIGHLLRSLLPDPLLPDGARRLHATAVLMGAATAAVWVFGQDVLIDSGGQSQFTATVAWSALGLCGLLGAAAGDIAHRVGLRAVWGSSAALIVLATAVIGVLPGEAALTVVASGAFGAAYIGMSGLILISAAATYHQHPAAGVGLAFLMLALGQSIGGSLVGGLLGWAGAAAAFAAAAGVAVLSAVLAPRHLVGPHTRELRTVERT